METKALELRPLFGAFFATLWNLRYATYQSSIFLHVILSSRAHSPNSHKYNAVADTYEAERASSMAKPSSARSRLCRSATCEVHISSFSVIQIWIFRSHWWKTPPIFRRARNASLWRTLQSGAERLPWLISRSIFCDVQHNLDFNVNFLETVFETYDASVWNCDFG